MGQVIKAYLGLFFLVILSLLGMGIISVGVEKTAAQNFHADIIEEIECSNFSPSVVTACISQASSAGYDVTVNNIVEDEYNNIQMAEVTLKYKYTIDVLEITDQDQIRGFAR